MKRALSSMFIGALLALASPLSAYYRPCSCEMVVSAEWLYLLQGLDQPNYAIDGIGGGYSREVIGERKANEQTWESGYRLELFYGLCDQETAFGLRWTHLPTFSNTRSVSGQSLFKTLPPPGALSNAGTNNGAVGTAEIADQFEFYALEALYMQHFFDTCVFDMGLYFGLHYAKIDLSEDFSLSAQFFSPQKLHFSSELWGIGPEVGAEFLFQLPSCFSAVVRCQGAFLASKRSASMRADSANYGEIAYDVDDTDYWTLIPATNVRAGLSYERCLCFRDSPGLRMCAPRTLHVEVGYEFMSYFDAISRIRFDDHISKGNSFNEQINFHLHGPYAHLGFSF